MNVETTIDDKRSSQLIIDTYNRLNKRQFISKLAELEGVRITKRSSFWNKDGFCRFEYDGESFLVSEDDWDYSFIIKSDSCNHKSLNALECYFRNLNVPKNKTRPVFWFACIVLIGLVLYV